MAILNYQKDGEVLYLSESAKDLSVHDESFLNCRLCLLHDNDPKKYRTNTIIEMFGKTDADCRSQKIIERDINPWIMCINGNLVIYFGEDEPMIKSTEVNFWNQDYGKWTNIKWKVIERTETYYYVDVNEPDKMFIFDGNSYHFDCHYNVGRVEGQYYTRYDYDDETLNILIDKKLKEDKERIEEQIELKEDVERRKKMSGYCYICGTANALYTVNPYNVKRRNDYSFHWICPNCYNSLITALINGNIYNDEIDDSDGEYIPEEFNKDTNGHEYLDMGLSVKWALCNVGATKPEDVGLYFAWGETTGYPNATSGKSFNWSDYKLCDGIASQMNKYCLNTSYGKEDDKNVLEPVDDAVTKTMGGDWRMPTKQEMQELFDACFIEWTTMNGVNGILLKLKVDTNKQLFFPAGDNCNSGVINNLGKYGYYWSSSLYSPYGYNAYCMFFSENETHAADNFARFNGFNIRGVI